MHDDDEKSILIFNEIHYTADIYKNTVEIIE